MRLNPSYNGIPALGIKSSFEHKVNLKVLILLLMEYPFWGKQAICLVVLNGLNPSSNGIPVLGWEKTIGIGDDITES